MITLLPQFLHNDIECSQFNYVEVVTFSFFPLQTNLRLHTLSWIKTEAAVINYSY